MAGDLPQHRLKLVEMFTFWGWDVREQDIRLAWHVEDVIDLAVWAVFRRSGEQVSREWVISEPTGMLPIDHLSAGGLPNAPSALREFATRWQVIANERLEDRLPPERLAELRRSRPQVLAQAQQMREMIGIAAELLLDCADEAGLGGPDAAPPAEA
jgi:hypothetical protein